MKRSITSVVLYICFLFLVFATWSSFVDLENKFNGNLESSNLDFTESNSENSSLSGYYDVISVTDGDTIRINYKGISTPVRLIGIDTPEVNHPSEPIQCYGKEASQKLTSLINGKVVKIERDVSETDRYGRILAYIWLNEELINETMVKGGYAFSSAYPPDIKYQSVLDAAEIYARTNELGLWSKDTCSGDVYTGTDRSK